MACGSIALFWPRGVVAEMLHPRAPETIKAAALNASVRPVFPLSARQQIDRIKVRAILRGDGRAGKHDADASHLSEAAEAGCRAFLTWDSKILRKRDTLREALPREMRIRTLAEFLSALDDGGTGLDPDEADWA